jgi:predicted TIM-barrel fold metal-dependent hydrolase
MGATDCHVHINPLWEMRPEVRALMGREGPAAQAEPFLRDPAKFLEYLDRSGIERAVLVNYVAPEVIGYTPRANDFVLEYCRADPVRLFAIGSVLPTHPTPGAEVERLHALGLRGLKIHPPHQLFAPNAYLDHAPGLREIYATCERLRMPVIVHTGTSVFPGARNRFGQPLLVEDVAIDFPRLTLVLAHGGRPLWMNEAMFLARRFPQVYLEVSSLPPARLLQYFPELERIGEKVLWGSDWPGPGVKDIGANVAAFRACGLPAPLLEKILCETPERVFPR